VRSRVAAALLVLAALAVHFSWTRSFRAQASASADEYRRLRDERRLAAAARAHDLRLAEATGRVGIVPGTSDSAPPARARRLVVAALASSRVSTVKLRVTPGGRAPVGAAVHLSGVGSFDDVARFTGELARPGNGLVLSSVGLTAHGGNVELSFDALALGER
jgi:hypothetical protein